jgi:adenine specific DNA methylase Mod
VNAVGYLETGVIHCDDNLHALAQFPAECVDLVYLDPPFFSNRIYEVIWGDEAEVRSFEDRWEGGINVYLDWMESRVLHLHRILKPAGSFYIHCDSSARHYLKVMLDSVFNRSNFRTEIIWKRTSAHSDARGYGRVHDTILFYTKSRDFTWNPQPQKQKPEDFRGHDILREANGAPLSIGRCERGEAAGTLRVARQVSAERPVLGVFPR